MHFSVFIIIIIIVLNRMSICNLTDRSCANVASVLQSANCPLRELNLSKNDMQDSGVEMISDGLKSSHCKLEILRFFTCSHFTINGSLHCMNLNTLLYKIYK